MLKIKVCSMKTIKLYIASNTVLAPIHRLVMRILCAHYFEIPPDKTKLEGRIRTSVSIAYAQSSYATCVLDLSAGDIVLRATHRLVMMIICAKQFS